MIKPDFYWTVIVAVAGGFWAMITAVRDRKARDIEYSRMIVDRLLESDRMIIEHPDIQRYLSGTAGESPEYFRKPERLNDDAFFKSKSYLYSQLNLFDDLLSTATQVQDEVSLIRPPIILEKADWEEYIKHRLKHPLCHSILTEEGKIFGHALQEFWNTHRADITRNPPDRFSW